MALYYSSIRGAEVPGNRSVRRKNTNQTIKI